MLSGSVAHPPESIFRLLSEVSVATLSEVGTGLHSSLSVFFFEGLVP